MNNEGILTGKEHAHACDLSINVLTWKQTRVQLSTIVLHVKHVIQEICSSISWHKKHEEHNIQEILHAIIIK